MITIVSGLPRSGTSLTMQMLKAGGYPILWNREPNFGPANPHGYYEWSEAKSLHTTRPLGRDLEQAEGKIVKLFPHSFPCLTPAHAYRIIYIDRDVRDVFFSHGRMMELEGRPKEAEKWRKDESESILDLERLRFQGLLYCKALPSLVLTFENLISFPIDCAFRMQYFVQGKPNGDLAREMAACVKPELRHW